LHEFILKTVPFLLTYGSSSPLLYVICCLHPALSYFWGMVLLTEGNNVNVWDMKLSLKGIWRLWSSELWHHIFW
jgi:hypothetical protein